MSDDPDRRALDEHNEDMAQTAIENARRRSKTTPQELDQAAQELIDEGIFGGGPEDDLLDSLNDERRR